MKKQIVIEIDEQDYEDIQLLINHCDYEKHLMLVDRICSRVAHGTVLPDNATNGEIMQMMFPDGVTAKFATFMRFVVGEDEYINCAYGWWNAPYQKGGK